ncbi:hypothetical protein ABZ714_04220 [Streptomyces sp. NPDC006798]|uniref:hypothetical protein n=1 Tax=Streptomyces sp. NPDC006798 TaxID=3155462 RepID=UPI0033D786B0
MDEMARVPGGDGTYGMFRRARAADPLVAGLVVMGNPLLCGWLFLMIIGTGLSDGQDADAAQRLAGQVYLGWLAGGLLLFAVLRLPRAAISHLVSLLLPPALFTAVLLSRS